jgi:hypothetical protein
MAWFSSADSDPVKLRGVIERVWPVIVTYSQAMAAHAAGGVPRPMSSLPESKTKISDALYEWLTLLARPATARTLRVHWPELVEELASPETIESLIVQYLTLSYYIPDRDAQVVRQLALGDFQGLSEYEVDRTATINKSILYDRGEREAKLKRLGYPTPS